jgi:hypothetical protein
MTTESSGPSSCDERTSGFGERRGSAMLMAGHGSYRSAVENG